MAVSDFAILPDLGSVGSAEAVRADSILVAQASGRVRQNGRPQLWMAWMALAASARSDAAADLVEGDDAVSCCRNRHKSSADPFPFQLTIAKPTESISQLDSF